MTGTQIVAMTNITVSLFVIATVLGVHRAGRYGFRLSGGAHAALSVAAFGTCAVGMVCLGI